VRFNPASRICVTTPQEQITVIQVEAKRTVKKKKLGIDHQHGQYYEDCKRSTKPRDLKARQ
jgi:hypothetical protein